MTIKDELREISPDIAVCEDCLADMKKQEKRINYPFVNCKNCGPRFSIARRLPFDRVNTTMDLFIMCPSCKSEYEDSSDRHYQVQTVACRHCGPLLTLFEQGERIKSLDEILEKVKTGLKNGGVYGVKGMGGFHMICDAFDENAIADLRKIKQNGKAFTLMFRSVEDAKKYVEIGKNEENLLQSTQRPIVLLSVKKKITKGIADGASDLGIMLPYMPFHHLLFEAIDTPAVVFTCGNFSDEPILIGNTKVHTQLENILSGIITYNREIYNRTDDSFTMVVKEKTQIIRRSRGYAPSPLTTQFNTEGIFAAGAELANSFCIGKDKNALMSQYIGNLKNPDTFRFYEETYHRYSSLFHFDPELIVHDLDPDYYSTKFARDLSEKLGGVPLLAVDPHHARIASAMLANKLDGEVIGISLDGAMGEEENPVGGEIMIVNYKEFEKLSHIDTATLPASKDTILEAALSICQDQKLNRVVLSGRSFQNRKFTENLMSRLSDASIEVYLPGSVPLNDQAIALGQLAIGAAKRS